MAYKNRMETSSTPISEFVTLGIWFVALMFTIFLNSVWGGIIDLVAAIVGFINYKRKDTAFSKIVLFMTLILLAVCLVIIIISGIKAITVK